MSATGTTDRSTTSPSTPALRAGAPSTTPGARRYGCPTCGADSARRSLLSGIQWRECLSLLCRVQFPESAARAA